MRAGRRRLDDPHGGRRAVGARRAHARRVGRRAAGADGRRVAIAGRRAGPDHEHDEEAGDAGWHDRTGTHGGQHGPAPDARRPRLRGPRRAARTRSRRSRARARRARRRSRSSSRSWTPPRSICIMVPAAVVDSTLDQLVPLLDTDDTVIDGGNSYYRDDIARAKALAEKGLHYVDMGTSGGVFGLERGYCLMIGGDDTAVGRLDSFFRTLAPGVEAGERTPGREGDPAPRRARLPPLRPGRRRALREDGPQRDRVRHDGRVRRGASTSSSRPGIGRKDHVIDAETTPLREPELYQYDFDIPAITEVWRRGSVVGSWLLDLTAAAFVQRPEARELLGPRLRLRRGPLDRPRGDRRGRARAGAHVVAVLPLRLARRGRVRRTRCCRRCGSRSAGTSSSRRSVGPAFGPARWCHARSLGCGRRW